MIMNKRVGVLCEKDTVQMRIHSEETSLKESIYNLEDTFQSCSLSAVVSQSLRINFSHAVSVYQLISLSVSKSHSLSISAYQSICFKVSQSQFLRTKFRHAVSVS